MLIDAFALLCYILLYLFITRDAIHTLLFLLFEWRNSRQRESSRCIFVLGSFFLSIIVMSRFLEDDLFRENKLKRRRENDCGKYRLLRNYWKFTLTREFIFNSSTKLTETFFFFSFSTFSPPKFLERRTIDVLLYEPREDVINYSLCKVVEWNERLKDAFIFDTPYCEQARLFSTDFYEHENSSSRSLPSCPRIIEWDFRIDGLSQWRFSLGVPQRRKLTRGPCLIERWVPIILPWSIASIISVW